MKILIRQRYLDKIENYLGKELIIVLLGQRRVGKSYMLKQLLKRHEAQSNIIYIDKEKREFDAIRTYQDLNAYLDSRLSKTKHNFILIDEVQDIEGFERSVRSFRTEPNTDVIITGSNAKMLSTELSTLIGGRYKEVRIQSLNYQEFLEMYELTDSDESLAKYIDLGGMPGLARMGQDADDAREYLTDIYHTVLLKDVVLRNEIRNVAFLENLVHFVADNIGKLISANSISKYMKSQGNSVTTNAVINYLNLMTQALIINKVNRYDIHGRRIFEANDKYYFADHGIRNAIVGGRREGDIEKVLENIVYQQLIGMGYQVYVGQLQKAEIDFVAMRSDGSRIYVQVSYVIIDEVTRQREFGNLHEIADNYPKYVISLTPMVTRNDCDGVVHLHLRRFLMNGFE